MEIFKLEHSKAAYRADFFLYSAAVITLTIYLLVNAPAPRKIEIVGLSIFGLMSWTLIEYTLHRLVLHGLPPFRRWHEVHHQQPDALICTPTILSGTLIALLVFLPALLLGDYWRACALTLGLLTGYLGYAITHHAIHHWRINHAWFKALKRQHMRHHHQNQSSFFGVTCRFWDDIFSTSLNEPKHKTRNL